jgi:hypothetical protein
MQRNILSIVGVGYGVGQWILPLRVQATFQHGKCLLQLLKSGTERIRVARILDCLFGGIHQPEGCVFGQAEAHVRAVDPYQAAVSARDDIYLIAALTDRKARTCGAKPKLSGHVGKVRVGRTRFVAIRAKFRIHIVLLAVLLSSGEWTGNPGWLRTGVAPNTLCTWYRSVVWMFAAHSLATGSTMIRCPSCGAEPPSNDATGHCGACGTGFQIATPVSQLDSQGYAHVKTITLNLPGGPTAPATGGEHSPPLPPPRLLQVSTLLAGRYRIIEALKSGGMGAIYLAHDQHQGNVPCAIKEMLDRFTNEDEREEGQAWFRREATTLANLQHELVPRIYDYFIDHGRYYLALEYIDGENLEDLLACEGRPGLPERMVLNLGAAICEVLTYLHSQTPPLIFRDLKPANIMITRHGDVRLVDFGIARSFSALRGVSMVGTPGYAPIEQYHGLADALSDLYSLGATMHHLLSGADPRVAPPFTHKPVRMLVPDISRATERLLEGALQKEPADRGPNIEEFGRQLRRIEADLAQGLVPAVIDTVAIHAPDVRMPPTLMTIAQGTMDLGTKTRGALHTLSFPVSNDGKTELRVVMRANVSWLHTPDGQLRVPPGNLVKVPLDIDCTVLPIGRHKARIEFDGNGGVESVAVEFRVTYWWLNGAGMLMFTGIGIAAVLAILAHVLIHFN